MGRSGAGIVELQCLKICHHLWWIRPCDMMSQGRAVTGDCAPPVNRAASAGLWSFDWSQIVCNNAIFWSLFWVKQLYCHSLLHKVIASVNRAYLKNLQFKVQSQKQHVWNLGCIGLCQCCVCFCGLVIYQGRCRQLQVEEIVIFWHLYFQMAFLLIISILFIVEHCKNEIERHADHRHHSCDSWTELWEQVCDLLKLNECCATMSYCKVSYKPTILIYVQWMGKLKGIMLLSWLHKIDASVRVTY